MNLLPATHAPLSPVGMDPEMLAVQYRSGKPQSIDGIAAGFESMFVSQVLKEMRQTLDSGTLFGGDTGDVCGGLFDLYLGQHISQNGGFGLAAAVKRQFEAATHPAPKPSGGTHGS